MGNISLAHFIPSTSAFIIWEKRCFYKADDSCWHLPAMGLLLKCYEAWREKSSFAGVLFHMCLSHSVWHSSAFLTSEQELTKTESTQPKQRNRIGTLGMYLFIEINKFADHGTEVLVLDLSIVIKIFRIFPLPNIVKIFKIWVDKIHSNFCQWLIFKVDF